MKVHTMLVIGNRDMEAECRQRARARQRQSRRKAER